MIVSFDSFNVILLFKGVPTCFGFVNFETVDDATNAAQQGEKGEKSRDSHAVLVLCCACAVLCLCCVDV
jgi:hypothetical protein